MGKSDGRFLIKIGEQFWTGSSLSDEYPDVQLYSSKAKAERQTKILSGICEIFYNYGLTSQKSWKVKGGL